ncbi:protein kinase C theta type-like [Aquarana catesbeiana]|uniref:protein kinase C theta type-like n=1 Tax=Aquarana catesbeiana TaxID=8400 RepID=UPI003CCA2BB4
MDRDHSTPPDNASICFSLQKDLQKDHTIYFQASFRVTVYFLDRDAGSEILKGHPYNTTVDYYSLGVIVNQMSFSMREFRQMKKIQGTTPGLPLHRIRPKDRNVHLEDLIDMLLCEDQDERARLVRDIRRHPFFKMTDWAEVEKGKSSAAFTPQPILRQRKDLNMKIEEFIAEEEEDSESSTGDSESSTGDSESSNGDSESSNGDTENWRSQN